ncbi:DUF7940 domain-containing protein [Leeia speluncae]|uniref:DUF7940 domain-containing protein n=1 Tax=Leeia speluncae TaxID=2884804 RepID=UPI00402BEF3B
MKYTKVKKVTNWTTLHRFWSVRLMAVIPLLAGLQEALPVIKDYIPGWLYVVVAVAAILARNVQQGAKE